MSVLQKFHWLPVWNKYKNAMIMMITSKIRHMSLPEYLFVSILLATYSQKFRSTGIDLVSILNTKSAPTNIACWAYSYATPMIWNRLLANLWTFAMTLASKTFVKHLKRHLFIEAFTKWSRDYTSHRFDSKSLYTWHDINMCSYCQSDRVLVYIIFFYASPIKECLKLHLLTILSTWLYCAISSSSISWWQARYSSSSALRFFFLK